MAAHSDILFTGSIGLEDEGAVFHALGEFIGTRATRYPDGETGDRRLWIRWQDKFLDGHSQFEVAEAHVQLPGFKDKVKRAFYKIGASVNDADLAFETIGYADHAVESFKVFRRLKDEGTIPANTRFQVSLPTPVALLSGFIVREDRARVEPAYERAMKAEIDRMAGEIPDDELAIQWDVCYEIVGHDGGPELHFDNILEASTERVCRLLEYVPEAVEAGIHLCYGDPGHKHIVEPEDTQTSVSFANSICASAPRPVNWMHLPVPKDRTDDAYFEPLTALQLRPETRLYLGLVHFTDGIEGTSRRIATAEKFVKDFGIATECGFGRRDPATIPELLKLHAEVADSA